MDCQVSPRRRSLFNERGIDMNLEFSVEKLYETGWQPEPGASAGSSGLEKLSDGRLYPSVLKIQEIFASAGFELAIRYVQLFDCYRAVWTDHQGAAAGAVVGADEREAAVYALAQLRKNATPAAAPNLDA
jgi:hypothetical protein